MTVVRSVSVDTPVGALVHALRTDAGLTQHELAKRIGTSQPAIARWEAGRAEPRLSTLRAVSTACGKHLGLILRDDIDTAQITAQLALSPEQRLSANRSVVRLRGLARTSAR